MAEKAEGNESESEGKERQGERYRATQADERWRTINLLTQSKTWVLNVVSVTSVTGLIVGSAACFLLSSFETEGEWIWSRREREDIPFERAGQMVKTKPQNNSIRHAGWTCGSILG
ncbi:uncharacterized protein BO96DRAFT_406155 [Aspergillus niger CBS 101883]|uniref:Uncharacterized protein n=3 Tax=Aspergillus niger TaxID=5061 RepID=A2Q8H2_ASPNC|nr:uncharacterized protein BO96DRAFT_406155 [Aspergillus niger CBS 101883]XP_059599624.1 hypothetical protein An01g04340 [Aspergillus niger]PYH50372.1 hypothetical protein BO96DRAFT_406155 [Aspergillus niger CBS 101883]RDH14262.1 hypothetical protein M747DRAFT_249897 [Aspergillus niger ATCC 13496]CAK36969.1 hypothetical protein An01g04340 [Aspergillus niger]